MCVGGGGRLVLHEGKCTMVNHIYVPESRCTQGASIIETNGTLTHSPEAIYSLRRTIPHLARPLCRT